MNRKSRKLDKRELYPLFDQNSRPILLNQEAANLSIEIGKIQNRLDSLERKKYIYWSSKILIGFFLEKVILINNKYYFTNSK